MRSIAVTLLVVAVLAMSAWAGDAPKGWGTGSTPTFTKAMVRDQGGSAPAVKTGIPMNMGAPAQNINPNPMPQGMSREARRQWLYERSKRLAAANPVKIPANLPVVRPAKPPSGMNTSSIPWQNEVQITNYSTIWDYATDYTNDGSLYAAFVDSTQHTWYTYRSTDDGWHWNQVAGWTLGDTSVRIGYPDAFKIVVRNSYVAPNSNRIYYFLGYRYGAGHWLDVWYSPLDSIGSAVHRASVWGTTVTPELQVTADWYVNSYSVPPYYHLVYKAGTDTTYFETSVDGCVTWPYTFKGFTNWPLSIAMGDTYGQYVKLAFNYLASVDSINVYFNADTSEGFWTSWIGDQDITRYGANRRFSPKMITLQDPYTFEWPSWITYERIPNLTGGTTSNALYFCYSMDGGLTWPDSSRGFALSDSITRYGATVEEFDNVYPEAFWRRVYASGIDSLEYAWCDYSNPPYWTTAFGVNSIEPDNYTDPGIVYTSDQGDNGGVVFGGPDNGDYIQGLYFTALWINTGVERGGPVALGTGLALGAARPNPFAHNTNIAFSLPKSGNVDLAVYDVAGRRVATLAKGTLTAGSHEASFNGSGVPAGVYFYRLNFEGKTLTNRMVVVR